MITVVDHVDVRSVENLVSGTISLAVMLEIDEVPTSLTLTLLRRGSMLYFSRSSRVF